jgi:hypothetical protein
LFVSGRSDVSDGFGHISGVVTINLKCSVKLYRLYDLFTTENATILYHEKRTLSVYKKFTAKHRKIEVACL